MKIATILGCRPEIIRLSRIIPKLDNLLEKNHILIHTGQNYNPKLSNIFFKELSIRQPNYYLGVRGCMGKQIAMILEKVEKSLIVEKPDKIIILGDTNSGLSSIIAEKMQIPVYHLEAGNRCFDNEVPEEINRKIIDHVSSYNLPYTPKSRDNLIKEGISLNKIFVSGNPIKEVLTYYSDKINNSLIINILNLKSQKYFLSTFHRSECVDNPIRLKEIIDGLNKIANYYQFPIIVSTHPRTRSKLNKNYKISSYIKFLDPFKFFDFVKLEKNALCVLSDSGTVSEETCILHIPNIIIRNTTERPETLEVGSSILSGINSNNIFNSTKIILSNSREWKLPQGYDENNVSQIIINILLSKGV